jgi:hypothetical protein
MQIVLSPVVIFGITGLIIGIIAGYFTGMVWFVVEYHKEIELLKAIKEKQSMEH